MNSFNHHLLIHCHLVSFTYYKPNDFYIKTKSWYIRVHVTTPLTSATVRSHLLISLFSAASQWAQGLSEATVVFQPFIWNIVFSLICKSVSVYFSSEAGEAQLGVCCGSAAWRYPCLHCSTHTRPHRGRTHTPGHGRSQCMYNAAELNALGTWVETHSPCNLSVIQNGFSSVTPNYFYIYSFAAMFCYPSNKTILLCVNASSSAISALFSVFWPHVYPVGLLPWSEGSDYVTHSTETHFPGAASAQCR